MDNQKKKITLYDIKLAILNGFVSFIFGIILIFITIFLEKRL